jgi:hypothetical protein
MSILKRIQGEGNPPEKPQQTGQNGFPARQTSPATPSPRRVVTPGLPASQDTYQDLKTRVQTKRAGIQYF